MGKINKQDYYFGAALMAFFTKNKDAKPSLVESIGSSSRKFLIEGDTSPSFYLYMKYVSKARVAQNGDLTWTFNFTSNEVQHIRQSCDECNIYIVLICNEKEFTNTHIAILTSEEYFSCKLDSITIKLEKHNTQFKKRFCVLSGEKSFYIRHNRFDEKISAIKDFDGKQYIKKSNEEFSHAKEISNLWQRAWNEHQNVYNKVEQIAESLFLVLIDTEKIEEFEGYLYRKWIVNSPYEYDSLGILQSEPPKMKSITTIKSGFEIFVKRVAKECQWEESYAACRIYGAIVGIVKEKAIEKCNSTCSLYIDEADLYNDCLKKYIDKVSGNPLDKVILGCFVYYLIKLEKIPFSDSGYPLPSNIGFVYACHQVTKDIALLLQTYQGK